MRPGERVGNYTILELLGRGGFGAVFKAKDEMTGALVALKAVHPDHARDRDFVRRLRDEARAAAAVSHPHVALFHTTGEHGGIPFLVFELVPGGTLDRLVRDRGPLPWREACARAAEIAGALSALHRAGIVHRDVKPANVLFDGTGRAKLADLGLARAPVDARSLTLTGEVVGTLAYLSPEQANAVAAPGPAADLYALGATLYALVAGEPPFSGEGEPAGVGGAGGPARRPTRPTTRATEHASAVIAHGRTLVRGTTSGSFVGREIRSSSSATARASGRSAGSFASMRATSASSSRGTSGATDESAGAGSTACFFMSESASPSKGGFPATSANTMQPRE